MTFTKVRSTKFDSRNGLLAFGWCAAAAFGICFALSVAFGMPGQPSNESSEVERIQHLIAQYATSIDGADATLAAEIWSKSPDVTFIHPRGEERGFAQVKENFYVHAMRDTFSERKLTVKNISVHVYGDAAWAQFYWDFAAKLKKDGSALNTKGRETQIYHKEQGQWRLVHVHYSGMPVTGEARGF